MGLLLLQADIPEDYLIRGPPAWGGGGGGRDAGGGEGGSALSGIQFGIKYYSFCSMEWGFHIYLDIF